MTARQRAYLAAYCRVGRKEILQYTDRYSCVASTRLTIETLKHLGIVCAPQAVKLHVRPMDGSRAYACGLSAEEMATAREVHHRQVESGQGWRGHLICVTADRRLLIDSSLDQADEALGGALGISTKVYAWPSDVPLRPGWRYEALCQSDIGVKFELTYVAVADETYLPSAAWNDAGLPLFGELLAAKIRKMVDKMPDSLLARVT